jgi:class 3 adenylate cyclase
MAKFRQGPPKPCSAEELEKKCGIAKTIALNAGPVARLLAISDPARAALNRDNQNESESYDGANFSAPKRSLIPLHIAEQDMSHPQANGIFLYQAGKRFCGGCGAPIDTISPIERESASGGSSGERRHLTVLFCDLVGSTEIAERLDPEEWREIVASYHHATTEAITRFGGYVAQYLGDGVMAYFGWPVAHDNDAERATRAGFGDFRHYVEAQRTLHRPKLLARVRIDSGAVVVGAGMGKDADVFGDTPNIAARLQATGAPGTVFITSATHRVSRAVTDADPS